MKSFKEYKNKQNWQIQENFNFESNPCEECGGKCCTGLYLSQGPITSWSEDSMKWASYHEGVEVYTAQRNGCLEWGIKIPNIKCKNLTEEGKCAINDSKPEGCKRYYGMNPDGPFLECNLIKELIKTKQIAYEESWVEKLWPEGPPKELIKD